jgi:tripartite-type tricarboxylate transporter receptor subunit TctC
MKREKKCYLAALFLIIALLGATVVGGFAQDYPTKPVRCIVPFPPGGAVDLHARIIGQKLSEKWGQQVVIDNRGGAGSTLGTGLAATAPPDGYTFIIVSPAFAINATLYSKLPFNTEKDFVPVTVLTSASNHMIINPSVPAKNLKEFIAYCKANPGKVNCANSGTGTGTHLAAVLFAMMAGVDIVHVPYKGGGAATTDLLAGHVQLFFEGVTAVPYIQSGKLRCLGVTTANRSSALPDVPTIAEAGLPGYEMTSWYLALFPAGTPQKFVTKLNRDIVDVLRMPDVEERLAGKGRGVEIIGSTPEECAAFTKAEIAKWAKVVKASGARAD